MCHVTHARALGCHCLIRRHWKPCEKARKSGVECENKTHETNYAREDLCFYHRYKSEEDEDGKREQGDEPQEKSK